MTTAQQLQAIETSANNCIAKIVASGAPDNVVATYTLQVRNMQAIQVMKVLAGK